MDAYNLAFSNAHHFKLLYFVGRYGGVTEASHHLHMEPSGMRKQVRELEEEVGFVVFDREFALTPDGQRLYQHAQEFFEKLPALINELRGQKGLSLSIGAPEVVLDDYLEDSIDDVKEQFPSAEINLADGDQASLEQLLRKHEIHVAATIFDTKPADDLCALPLLELPLALVVPSKSKWKSAEEFWKYRKLDEPFLLLPAKHAITQHFRDGLKERGVKKFAMRKADTTELIEKYVRKGWGIGVSVMAPAHDKATGVRYLPLKDFKSVTFGLLWQQSPNALMTAFVEAVKTRSKVLQTP